MSKGLRFRSWFVATLVPWLAGCLPADRGDVGAKIIKSKVSAAPIASVTAPPAELEPAALRERRFSEAPMLAERVAAGNLPPVAQRLPENPFVVRPIEQIGVYGGTIKHAIMSEYEGWTEVAKCLNENLLGFTRPSGDGIEVDLAESYTVAPDGMSAVFHLRKGVKWSDGVPFTVDDILFWYYDVLQLSTAQRPGLAPVDWLVDGKPIKLEKIDDHTLAASATKPMGLLLIRFCHENFALPAHYFKPYHPKYNPKADYRDFNRRCLPMYQTLTPGVPRLSAWIPVQWNEGQRVLFERNPYYFKVDTAGNQLPYADRISFAVVADPRVILLKFTTGELDLIGRYVSIDWLPTLAAEVPKGRFKLYSRKAEAGPAIYFNWDVGDAGLRDAFRDRRVREALSIAINRPEVSRIVFHGNLTPGGFTLAPNSPYFWSEGFQIGSEYDPERARRLLEDAGFKDSDGDGIRELHNGRRFEVAMDFEYEKNVADLVELVTEYWRAVGVRVFPHGGRDEIVRNHRMSGAFQTFASRTTLGAEDPRGSSMQWVMYGPNNPFWHRDAAKNPPPWLREGTDLFVRSFATVDPIQVRELMVQAQKLFAAEFPAIGFGSLTRPWAANLRIGNVPPDGNYSIAVRGWGRSVFHEQLFIRPAATGIATAP